MFRRIVGLAQIALCIASAGVARSTDEVAEFQLSGALLREVARQGVVAELPVTITATGGVHPPENDCEMHWAAEPRIALGAPGGLVLEPPNVCRSWPPAAARRGGRRVTWRDYAERRLVGAACTARGFVRIAAEHAEGGGSPATPPHVVEIHPLLALSGEGVALDFADDLRVVGGMVRKRPEIGEPTVRGRRLFVRRRGDDYELRDNGAGANWNFSVVALDAAAARVRAVRGGHQIDARVRFRPDGPALPLTLYTLTGTAADARAATWPPDGATWRVLGLLTYDPLAILAAVRDARGAWTACDAWTEVRRPLAMVVWGETAE